VTLSIGRGLLRFTAIDDRDRAELSLWICNGNRILQHAIANRQSNFQACSFNHSDISPFKWNQQVTVTRNPRFFAIVISPLSRSPQSRIPS